MSVAYGGCRRGQNRGTRTRNRECCTLATGVLQSPEFSPTPPDFITSRETNVHLRNVIANHGARLLGRRRCRFRACNHRNRIREISLHAVGGLRFNLYGYCHWSHDTFICITSSTMRPGNGFHRERLANSITNAGDGDWFLHMGVPG